MRLFTESVRWHSAQWLTFHHELPSPSCLYYCQIILYIHSFSDCSYGGVILGFNSASKLDIYEGGSWRNAETAGGKRICAYISISSARPEIIEHLFFHPCVWFYQLFCFVKLIVIELGKLGKRMAIRQQALATAQVYMRRYYTKVEIRRTNPYLVLSTAFYLACKVEECPQHIRLVVGEARQFWPGTFPLSPATGNC
jgi:hypothetical protein